MDYRWRKIVRQKIIGYVWLMACHDIFVNLRIFKKKLFY